MSALSAHAHSPHPYAASASGHDEHDRGRDSRAKSIHSNGRSVYSQESSEIGASAGDRGSGAYPSSPLQKPTTPRSLPIPTSSSHADVDRDFFDLDAAEMHSHHSRSGSLRSIGKGAHVQQQPPPVPPPPGRPPPVPRSPVVAPPTPELVNSPRARSNTQTTTSSVNSSMPTPPMVARRPSELYRRPSEHANLPHTSSPLIHPVDYSREGSLHRRPSAESTLSSSPYMMATRGRKTSADQPTQPTSPLALVSEEKRPLGRSDADIRALFDALPPEAQELAAKRLAEQQQRLEEEKLQAKKQREEQRRLEALLADQQRRREEEQHREAQRRRAVHPGDLLNGGQSDPGGETPPTGRSLERHPTMAAPEPTPISPTRPAGTEGLGDTDVRRMIEARIKALQTALEGLEEPSSNGASVTSPTGPPSASGSSPPNHHSPYLSSRGPPAPSSQYGSRAELQQQFPHPGQVQRPTVAVPVPTQRHHPRVSPHRSSPHSPHSPHSVSSLMFELDDGSPTGSNNYKGFRTPPPEYNSVEANPSVYRGGRI